MRTDFEKECIICKKSFLGANKASYCSDECRREGRRLGEIDRRKYMFSSAIIPTKQKKVEKPKPASIYEENLKAKELGMSYGQYQFYKQKLEGKYDGRRRCEDKVLSYK